MPYVLGPGGGGDCEQVEEVRGRHERWDGADYRDEDLHRSLEAEMLAARRAAASKLALWRADGALGAEAAGAMRLGEAHTLWLGLLERRLAEAEAGGAGTEGERREVALELCRVKGLVQRGADEVNEYGEARLLTAAAEGWRPRDLRLLVAAGADVRGTDAGGQTAVMCAAVGGHTATAETLVELGADVNAADGGGVTAMMCAAVGGHVETLRALAALRGDVNAATAGEGLTALMCAAVGGHTEAVRALVALGAERGARDGEGTTAAGHAADKGHADIAALLE